MQKISYIDMKVKDPYMNYAEQKKLTAAANKLLRGSGKKKTKSKKYPGTNLPFKLFAQHQGSFPAGQSPTCIELKCWEDMAHKNRQNGRFEYLQSKTYYKINLKRPGIYFFQNLEIVLRKEFYYKAGSNGFFSLTPDGKIHPMTEEEAQGAFQ